MLGSAGFSDQEVRRSELSPVLALCGKSCHGPRASQNSRCPSATASSFSRCSRSMASWRMLWQSRAASARVACSNDQVVAATRSSKLTST